MKKSILSWEELRTEIQKRRLIDAVRKEIKKLQESPALKDIFGDGITLAQAPYSCKEFLEVKKNGTLEFRRKEVSAQELDGVIVYLRIEPKVIARLRKEIER